MLEVREYNLATGHVECLTKVRHLTEALRYIRRYIIGEKSADHVVYVHNQREIIGVPTK